MVGACSGADSGGVFGVGDQAIRLIRCISFVRLVAYVRLRDAAAAVTASARAAGIMPG
jgi:hypothetical protein